jgi:hypothetical protein
MWRREVSMRVTMVTAGRTSFMVPYRTHILKCKRNESQPGRCRCVTSLGQWSGTVGCGTLLTMFNVPLVARLHVDLQRVVSAACPLS